MKVFSSQESFAPAAAEKAFLTTGAPLSHLACCREMYSNRGIHYHHSTLSPSFVASPSCLKSDHGILVHFSTKSLGYVAAYRFVCKSDEDVLHSAAHPDLQPIGTLPVTKKYKQTNNKKASSRKGATSSHSSTSKKT